MRGYKVMRIEDGELVAGADSRQRFPLRVGSTIRMTGKGVYLSPHRQYVLDYYSGLAPHEALLTLEFDPDALITGDLRDKEPEVSVREVKVVDYEILTEENPRSVSNLPTSVSQRARTYYHGTMVEAWGQKIARERKIRPGSEIVTHGGWMKPLEGYVYMTSDLRIATTYAVEVLPPKGVKGGDFGYVFAIEGAQLDDLDVDEDVVGVLAEAALRRNSGDDPSYDLQKIGTRSDDAFLRSFLPFVREHLTAKEIEDFLEFRYQGRSTVKLRAKVGKKLEAKLSEKIRREILALGGPVRHLGPVDIFGGWRLPKKGRWQRVMLASDQEFIAYFDEVSEPLDLDGSTKSKRKVSARQRESAARLARGE